MFSTHLKWQQVEQWIHGDPPPRNAKYEQCVLPIRFIHQEGVQNYPEARQLAIDCVINVNQAIHD